MIPTPCSATEYEIEQVRRLISDQGHGAVYVEIGSFTGGSLAAYGGAMPTGSVLVAIDRPINAEAMADLCRTVQSLRRRNYDAHVIEGPSQSEAVLNRLGDILGPRRIDVLVVDGDHHPRATAADLDTYLPLVVDGGLVVMHDCGLPDPARSVSKKVAAVMAGLHPVWLKYAAGKQRVLIQEWCGYGGWWQ